MAFTDVRGVGLSLGGGRGPRGVKGDKPGHVWNGTSLAFEEPDGDLGAPVDLRGAPGPAGDAALFNTVASAQGTAIDPGYGFVSIAGYSAAGDGGAGLYKRVGAEPTHAGKFQSVGGQWWELVEQAPRPQQFNLPTSGDQTTAFTRLEGYATGKRVDLGGLTYTVTAIPNKNEYANGFFQIAGRVRSTLLFNERIRNAPVLERNGGQLRKLKRALMNPLEQITGVCLCGDSITWGSNIPDNAVSTPRSSVPTDPRDTYVTASWANEFKRYLGRVYAGDVAPILTNWATSPSGQSTAEFAQSKDIYPGYAPFTFTTTGSNVSVSNTPDAGTRMNNQYRIDIATNGSTHDIDFTFTGTRFDLIFAAVTGETQCDYELFVDGVSQGTFSMSIGTGGIVNGYGNSRTHTFSYIRNKTIRLRFRQKAPGGTTSRARIEAIVVPKRIIVTNQGLNGVAARVYANNALSGNFGGVAISNYDNFIFCQLGTNDRGNHTTYAKGPSGFRNSLAGLVTQMATLGDVVLMCANPTTDFDPATMNMQMIDIRGVIRDVAASANLDFIDNYAAFEGYDLSTMLADNLHPNRLGHAIMARNIIGALEAA